MDYQISCLRDFANHSENSVFVRCIGASDSFLYDLSDLDNKLSRLPSYNRIIKFEVLSDRNLIQSYTEKYEDFCKAQPACMKILSLYRQGMANQNKTIEKNLIISIIHWYESYIKPVLKYSTDKKFVCSGKIGYKEYLFCCFAYLLGFDVMILLPEGDLKLTDILLNQSQTLYNGKTARVIIPEYQRKSTVSTSEPENAQPPVSGSRPKLHIPPHPDRAATSGRKQESVQHIFGRPERIHRKELSYEELAKLAASVVMIAVCDQYRNVIGSGSGIVISRDGYILTNCHVITKGAFYAVRLENDDKIYPAYQVIKYHTEFDMAVIKIENESVPLKIYSESAELVRGQKVVAIGSPMGLFNTVSDGIISGFREMDNQEMIQFTAPISNGSSGGALLNTYGEVIGMSTASISKGQNMNLAVSYKSILPFIRGFLK